MHESDFKSGLRRMEEVIGRGSYDNKAMLDELYRNVRYWDKSQWEKTITRVLHSRTGKWLPDIAVIMEVGREVREGSGNTVREKVSVDCPLCDGEGLLIAIGKFSDTCPDRYYTMAAKCSCDNSQNYGTLKRRSEVSGDKRIEVWCKVKRAEALLAEFSKK